jgi:hypothetical protein
MALQSDLTIRSEKENLTAPAKGKNQVFAVVVKKIEGHAPFANILADKHGICYHLVRNFKLDGEAYGRSLELNETVIFHRPEGINIKKPVIIREISQRPITKLLNLYARMIRGIGESSNQVFVDSLKMTFEFDIEALSMLAPEGVPFIAGLGFDLKRDRGTSIAVAKITSFYGITGENITFDGCPWSIKRKNVWSDNPNYAVKPPYIESHRFPHIKIYAKCFKARAGRNPEECLCKMNDFKWVQLWKNSRIREVKFDLETRGYSILTFEEHQLYSIKAVKSWLDDRLYEVKARVASKKYSPEHHDFMELRYELLEADD